MRHFLLYIFTTICLAQIPANTTAKLTVRVSNIPNNDGHILLAVYNKETGFREKEHTFRNVTLPSAKGDILVTIDHLPPGEYAIAVFHDENKNGQLDKNLLGIPKEYYGFSNNAMGSFGPPSFKQCSFRFDSTKEISIRLK